MNDGWSVERDGTYRPTEPDDDFPIWLESLRVVRDCARDARREAARVVAESRRLRYLSQLHRRRARELRLIQ